MSNMDKLSAYVRNNKKINQWSPCIWATWNGHGYDYPLAEKENYRSLLPIYVLKTNPKTKHHFLPLCFELF